MPINSLDETRASLASLIIFSEVLSGQQIADKLGTKPAKIVLKGGPTTTLEMRTTVGGYNKLLVSKASGNRYYVPRFRFADRLHGRDSNGHKMTHFLSEPSAQARCPRRFFAHQ